jgi:predicted AAA+ superfamily ATPase
MRFMQHLTEAVNQRPRSAVVYSLQASVGEAVGEAVGEEGLLAQLEKIHSRIDVRKEPVAGDEVLRVVQRRLFAELPDEHTRREIASVYSAQLREHLEATAERESDRLEAVRLAMALEDRIVASYPFHPELIDLMHQRWGSLPNYQRTRGALQFLATVVNALWTARGERAPGALVGPGDVDLTHKDTRANFLEQVGQADQYSSVVEADFLAADAGTRAIDARIGRSGVALERLRVGSRVATAIMLPSFSGKDFGEQRGATEREIVDASLVPGLDAHLVREALAEM